MKALTNQRRLRLALVVAAMLLSLALTTRSFGAPAEVNELVRKAAAEKEVNWYGPHTFPAKDVRFFEQGIKKKYGIDLKINFEPSRGFETKVAQIITETAAGRKPDTDVLYTGGSIGPSLAKRRLLDEYDWKKVFPYIPDEAILFNKGAVVFHQFLYFPVYNTRMVSKDQAPKRWEDFLDPKWKGKLMLPRGLGIWVNMASTWGVEKTSDYLKKLGAQDLAAGRFGEAVQRVATGEFPLLVYMESGAIRTAQNKGAPLEMAFIEPIPIEEILLAPLKGSPHPNAGKLLIGYLVSGEGLKIFEERGGTGSYYIKGSWSAKAVAGKKLAVASPEFHEEHGAGLRQKFGDDLGVR